MADAKEDILLIGGLLGGAYLLIVRPILNVLGDDPENKQTVENLDAAPVGANPFLPTYAPLHQWAAAHFTGGFAGLSTWYQDLTNYDCGSDYIVTGGGEAECDIKVLAETIYYAFSFWHGVRLDDINAAFNLLPTKMSVARVSLYMQVNFDVDLLDRLKYGSQARISILNGGRNGLNDNELAPIVKRVLSLP